MSEAIAHAVLEPHPSTPNTHVRQLGVSARRSGAKLLLGYALHAQLARVRIPAAQAARAADELWRHTCFEAFVALPGAAGYLEFNFSPSNQWAVYAFHSYRTREANDADTTATATSAPRMALRTSATLLELDASITLPDAFTHQPLHIGLSAVIEDDAGALSYWALRHAAGKPDFHNRHSFALTLESEPGR